MVALSNASGSTVEVYEYSAFGEVAATDANNPNPFTFTGREFDKETGLYFYRARYYNPAIGRFLQTDPAGGANLYPYCGNNPIGSIDPSGCHNSEHWHYHVAVPAAIFFDYNPSANNITDLENAVVNWLAQFDALCNHGDWSIDCDGLSDRPGFLDLVVQYLGPIENPDSGLTDIPGVYAVIYDIPKDATMRGWVVLDPTVVDKVPVLFIDGVGMLDVRAFSRMIQPALDESLAFGAEMQRLYDFAWAHPGEGSSAMLQSIAVSKFFYMKDSWDSFFFDLGGTPFKWLNREIYSASDINYYAGGWAFRALGYGWESTWYDIAAWKYFTYRRIGEMPGVEFWTTMGYSDCCWRLGWLP